jgi:hypothetical protein
LSGLQTIIEKPIISSIKLRIVIPNLFIILFIDKLP